MSLFRIVQWKLLTFWLLQLFTLYNSQNFSLPQVQTVYVGLGANDTICWPSKSRSLVIEEACGSHPAGCWRRPVLIRGVWGHNMAASSLHAAVASGGDARTRNQENLANRISLYIFKYNLIPGANMIMVNVNWFFLILLPYNKAGTEWLNMFAA